MANNYRIVINNKTMKLDSNHKLQDKLKILTKTRTKQRK